MDIIETTFQARPEFQNIFTHSDVCKTSPRGKGNGQFSADPNNIFSLTVMTDFLMFYRETSGYRNLFLVVLERILQLKVWL